MATAVTTGSIALLVEANRSANYYPARPSLTPNAVKAILQYTALGIHDDTGVEYDALRKGAGSLNTKGAIDLGRVIDTEAPVGSSWLTRTPYHWTTIGTETLVWNQSIMWGSSIMWGDTVDVNQTAWGSSIMWGSTTSWGSSIMWGSNVVWTNPQSWANSIMWGSNTIGQSNGTSIMWGDTTGINSQNAAWKNLSSLTTTTTGAVAGQ
jgi:hypothetical protein